MIHVMSDDEIREFVMGVCDGRIFTNLQLNEPEDLPMVFIMLGLGGLPDGVTPDEIGCIWEYMSEAGPRAINGMPCFFSARFMNVEDFERARKAIVAELKRRESIEV